MRHRNDLTNNNTIHIVKRIIFINTKKEKNMKILNFQNYKYQN